MKFILFIGICSFSTGECMPPIKYIEYFDDWKSCAIKGLEVGKEALEKIETDKVNKYNLSIQYSCELMLGS